MLVKRKEKKNDFNYLKGLKFTHHSTNLVYTISKSERSDSFKVSWGDQEGVNISGFTFYLKEEILENIKSGIWILID
jgi:hypothetical protein